MNLEYEPASEPLNIFVKRLFLNREELNWEEWDAAAGRKGAPCSYRTKVFLLLYASQV